MALTSNSNFYAAIQDVGINRVVRHAMRQRPSLFNYGTALLSAESGRGAKIFDSRALGRSDLLAVVLLRPGAYSVTNASNGTKAELKVAYPEKPLGLLEPVKVTCGSAISPAVIKVQPTQGLVFSFEAGSRVKIELVAPDDRPRPSVPMASPSKAVAGATPKKHSRRLQLFPRHQART